MEMESTALARVIERCKKLEAEYWSAIGEKWDEKTQAVSDLVEIVFALTADQIGKMDAGLTVADLGEDQRRWLSDAAPRLERFGPPGDDSLEKARMQILGNGSFRFAWTAPPQTSSINWLPYSWRKSETISVSALDALSSQKETILRRHYADFRQAADCARMAFALALTLSPDQIAASDGNPGLSCAALQPGQLALLKAFGRLYPAKSVSGLENGTVIYQTNGQFWSLTQDAESGVVHQYGIGWLPSIAH
jgi:hypothetical protein